MTSVPGVISGQVEQFQLDKSKNKFQLFIFYPGDFKPCSEELLTQFSSSQSTFLSLDCQVYAVSGDSVQSHQQWSPSLPSAPVMPLLSDAARTLSTKWGLIETEDNDDDEVTVEKRDEEAELRLIVITDNEAVMLEMINTDLASQQLVEYSRERVEMLVEKRRRAVDREYREKMERQELGASIEVMLGTMNSFTSTLVTDSRRARERSINRCRDLSRSLSRSSRTRNMSNHRNQGCADPVASFHYKRTVDRLVKGFF